MSPANKDYIDEMWVAIKTDISHFQKGLTQSNVQMKTWAGKMGAMSGQLKQFGRITTIASGATLALGAIATAVFAKFEQSIANVGSVLGATKVQMKELSDFAREMGRTTVFTASQAADAMYFLASAGFSAQQSMAALKGTLDLAAATQFDLAETTRIVVSTLNQFSMAAEDATKVSNVFAAVISGSQATMDKLGESMKFVGPVAASLNLKLEQVTAALGL